MTPPMADYQVPLKVGSLLRRNPLRVCLFLVVSLLLLLLAAYFALMVGEKDSGQRTRELHRENRLLETIIGLARQESPYLILDLRNNSKTGSLKIELQHKGVNLKQFSLDSIKVRRTRTLPIEAFPLIEKASFSPPQRKEVKPSKAEPDGAGANDEFLELKDFPSNYSLSFGGRLRLSVIGKNRGMISWFPRTIRAIFTHLQNSFILVWNYVRGNDFTVMEITMDQKDAQAFYWSLEGGIKIVIIEG